MRKINTFFTEMYIFWRDIFFGNDKRSSIFSFEGKLSQLSGWGTASILYFILQVISWFGVDMVTYIFGLSMFYCVLTLVQKRCRDFGSTGSFWVIFVTIVMLLDSCTYFVGTNSNIVFIQNLQQLANILYCLLIIPLLIPSKAEADLRLRSPLLKYPLVYIGICWALAIAATLTVNHYAGVTMF